MHGIGDRSMRPSRTCPLGIRPGRARLATLAAIAAIGTASCQASTEVADGFAPAPSGCAMAHCDSAMSDLADARLPGVADSTWIDAKAASDSQGLGCSSNRVVVACSFGDQTGSRGRAYLKTYDAYGKVLWTSGNILDAWAWTSVPIVSRAGAVIAADDTRLVRFLRDGSIAWSARTPGGRPISPTQTANGAIVLATNGGPVSAYDPRSGRRLGTLDLTDTLDGLPGRFDTTNTPGARGNRVYVSTQFTLRDGSPDPNHHVRLYAIDVHPRATPARRLSVAWTFDFGARSGASPLVIDDVVIFDGDRPSAESPFSPRFFGVRDLGDRPQVVWRYRMNAPGAASAAQDPRGGAWVFAFGDPRLRRISVADGTVLQTIDLDGLIGEDGKHTPFSAMTVARGPAGHPTMTLTARNGLVEPTSVYVAGIDLATGTLLWKFRVPGVPRLNTPEGQFPIVRGTHGDTAIVFSMRGGVRAVGDLRGKGGG